MKRVVATVLALLLVGGAAVAAPQANPQDIVIFKQCMVFYNHKENIMIIGCKVGPNTEIYQQVAPVGPVIQKDVPNEPPPLPTPETY